MKDEMESSKFQFGISKTNGREGLRKFSYAVTKKRNKWFILEEEQKEAFSKCFGKIHLKCEKIQTVVHDITFNVCEQLCSRLSFIITKNYLLRKLPDRAEEQDVL